MNVNAPGSNLLKHNWSVGRVGRRHFPAKKAYLIRVSLVRIQYTPPLSNCQHLTKFFNSAIIDKIRKWESKDEDEK